MKFSLRRLIVTVVIVLLVAATTTAGVFISTFDLNHFRAQISDAVSEQFSQPVNLGKAQFSIKHGPSFAFKDILIGQTDQPLHLTAEQIFFRLEVLPLLIGEFRFSEILFEKPDIRIKTGLRKDDENTADERRPEQALFSGTEVRSIRILNGHIRVEDYSRSETPFVVALEKLRMVIDDLSLRKSGRVEMQADINCNNIRSPFSLNGDIKAGDSTPFWNHAHYKLNMQVNDFASDVLSNRYQDLFSRFRIEGRVDIKAEFNGSPAKGLNFSTLLSGRDLGLKLPGKKTAIAAGEISLDGNWQSTGKLHRLEGLHLAFGPLNISARGVANLEQADPTISATINAPRIAMADIDRLLLKEKSFRATAGTLRLNHLVINSRLSELRGTGLLSAIKELDLDLLKGEVSYGGKAFNDIDLAIGLQDRQILLRRLNLKADRTQLSSDGTVAVEPGESIDSMALSGQVSLNLQNRVQSTATTPLLPKDGLKAIFHLDADYDSGTWTLKNNLLALPSVKVILQGRYSSLRDKAYSLQATIPEFALSELFLISPAISAIRPDGKMSGDITLRGNRADQPDLSGQITLDQAALRIAGPLADLADLNGTIELDWPRVQGEGLKARLGDSPIGLGLEIPDLTSPKVNLAIQGESIRADELIFRNEEVFLRDVDAHLSITDKALHLGPIDLRMDRGTNVTVNGTVSNFPQADTRLTIDGRYGNIDEVISLWLSDDEKYKKQKKRKKAGLLEIDIKTEAGEIANLPFEESEGHISYRDRTLIINPIQFKSGPGIGLGQVLVKYRDNLPPLLRISGHLENFDALAVYQQLLQRKGIITGRLWGDFYLEGNAGNLKDVFLPSSYGAFDFIVRDGVLKKLRGLSNALTLFNIYPIFTSAGKERGVPFAKLHGNTILNKGILSSDNLSMQGDVMNMTMTGSQNLISSEVDLELGIMPLRTIDRLLTKIPLAGWILTGEDKALVTAHFRLTGPGSDPEVEAIPVESASKQVIGLFRRLFTLPVKIVSDVNKALEQ